jgi:hypothetical protein
VGDTSIPLDDILKTVSPSAAMGVFFPLDDSYSVCFSVPVNGNCAYCFPAGDFILSTENRDLRQRYSALFPMQFVTVIYNNLGVTLAIAGDSGQKEFFVRKDDDNLHFGFTCLNTDHTPPDVPERGYWLIKHEPSWQEGFLRYRNLYLSKHKKAVFCGYFSESFHFKRYAFHKVHLRNNVFAKGRYRLWEEVKKDEKAFGKIDMIQLFDWGYSKKAGRNGAVDPADKITSINKLNAELAKIKKLTQKVLIYFDAYFVTKKSPLSKLFGKKATIKGANQKPYYQLGEDNWVICPFNREWRNFIQQTCLKALSVLNADGLYLDQTGYGVHYLCSDRLHNHTVPSNQSEGEYELLGELQAINAPVVTEYFPADFMLPLVAATLTDNDSFLVASRFVFPWIRQFKVISCDEPVGDNVSAVNKAFFNGLGLWLDGDSAGNKWYSNRVKKKIKKHRAIQKKYSPVFSSLDVTPLVGARHSDLMVNRFVFGNIILRTLFNPTEILIEGYFLPANGDSAQNAYDGEKAKITTIKEGRFIYCRVEAFDVGCIVERL